jgi:hypothetical protein
MKQVEQRIEHTHNTIVMLVQTYGELLEQQAGHIKLLEAQHALRIREAEDGWAAARKRIGELERHRNEAHAEVTAALGIK